jgi:uncharacterized protein YjiK
MAKPPRLTLVERLDLPIHEASGVAVTRHSTGDRVVVVGDRTSVAAVATLRDGRPDEVETIDLTTVDGWPSRPGDSQFEAIACDGGTQVALLREDPAEVLVIDLADRRLLAHIPLLVPRWSALAGKWDDPSSRGEGLVLLRGGRLLVAKEKRPRALIEFGPAGTSPRGVGQDDLLAPDEAWTPPAGDAGYHALAVWKLKDAAKKTLGDISALAVGRDRALWLLSDKSGVVARLDLSTGLRRGGGTITNLDTVFRLPAGLAKPEGMAMLDDDTALIALDTPGPSSNGAVVRNPSGLEGQD